MSTSSCIDDKKGSYAQSKNPLDLTVKLGPLELAFPVINASGTMELLDLATVFGEQILQNPPVSAYVPKTITLESRAGNAAPRILETASGMINAIGLQGEGLESFVAYKMPRLLYLPCALILSIGGFSLTEYEKLAIALQETLEQSLGEKWIEKVGLELNLSCPNVATYDDSGDGCACPMQLGTDPHKTEQVVSAVRKHWPGLLIAKLTPNVTDIAEVALAAEIAGADAISAVNTYKGLLLDRKTLKPFLGNITGGLSGPAIKPLALRAVYDIFARVSIPIIGMGGIASTQDAMEFMACGASVVAVGSAGFSNPMLGREITIGLAQELTERNLTAKQVVGCAHS